MLDVVTVGTCTEDTFLKPDTGSLLVSRREKILPHPLLCMGYGEKITVEEVHQRIGGSACNVAVGLKRLGVKTGIIGVVGKDFAGLNIIKQLKKEKIFLKHLKVFPKIKTNFSIIINYKDERTILTHHGFNDYSKLPIPKGSRSHWIFLGPLGGNYQTLYKQAIVLAGQKNCKIALNPGVVQIRERDPSLKSLLRVSKVLFINKEEAEDLIGNSLPMQLKQLLNRMKDFGPEIVIITDGGNGVYATNGVNYYHLPAARTEVVDSTGAGDAFSAGFLAYWLKDENLSEALKWGLINSTLVIEKWGAQIGLANQRELRNNLAACPKLHKI